MIQTHRDRSVMLAVMGGFVLLGGLGLLAMAGLTGVAMLFAPPLTEGPDPAASYGMGIAFYGLLGLGVVVVGGGLIACRRWARSLALVGAWALAILGVLLAVIYALLLPSLLREVADITGAAQPPAAVLVVALVAFAFGAMLVPGALLAYLLSRPDVRLTCEWRDRKESWTDRCPLPVLALSLMLGISAVSVIPAGLSTPAALAGRILEGPAAAALYAAWGVLLGLLAWGLYRLRPWAWWATAAVMILGLANAAMILRPEPLAELHRLMGMPEDQVELSVRIVMLPQMLAIMGVSVLGMAAWMAIIRKHFRAPAE